MTARRAALLLTFCLLPLLSSPARADNLDRGLMLPAGKTANAPVNNVLVELAKLEVANVGILPFTVKKGKQTTPSFTAGPINTGISERLENALVMIHPAGEKQSVGIIHDASGTASKGRVGAWASKPEERKKLFDQKYKLAWGNETVKADAFITGVIETVGVEMKHTKVTIQAFTKAAPQKLVKLTEFTVDTDREMLGALGFNINYARSPLAKVKSRSERDQQAVQQASQVVQGQKGGESGPDDVGGLALKILYNGVEQPITRESQSSGSDYLVPPIAPGTQMTFTLVRNGKVDKKLGAVVRINDLSTWNLEQGDPEKLRRWLYPVERRDADLFEGFYIGDKGDQIRKFEVISSAESQSRAADLGQKVGYIEIDVFASGIIKEPEQVMTISTRGLSRSARSAAAGKGLPALQAALYKANHFAPAKTQGGKVKARSSQEGGLIVGATQAVEVTPPAVGDLPNPVRVGHILIRYNDPGMKISRP